MAEESIPIPIYKVNRLKDSGTIVSIHVFYGTPVGLDTGDSLDDLFARDPENQAFAGIFNEEEMRHIKEIPIPVFFSTHQIHLDDNIETIKIKIALAFTNATPIAIEEIYLFGLKEATIYPETIYQILTQNGRAELTTQRVKHVLENIERDENGDPVNFIKELTASLPDPNIITYDDILRLNIANKKYWVSSILGQRHFVSATEYPFIYNPFYVTEYDDFAANAAITSRKTVSGQLLLNTCNNLFENTIYLCLAQDVLEYQSTVSPLSGSMSLEKYTMQLYYPFLTNKDILTLDDLTLKREQLLTENRTRIHESVMKSVDIFYDIYKEKTTELLYRGRGVKYIKCAINPINALKIPLDNIFKILHAEKDRPLIKFNPQTRQENVYRLYAPEITTDGRKIPHLSKSSILKLIRGIGKTKSVSVYIKSEHKSKLYSIVCEFQDNGKITISSEFETILSLEEIDDLFNIAVNPIITDIKNYLEQNGYSLELFNRLDDENMEILELTYQSIIEVAAPVNFDSVMGCVSGVFVIESKNKNVDSNTGVDMRLKRVGNFNKMASQEAFIIEKQKQGFRDREIIESLVENYNVAEQDARDLLSKVVSELQVKQGIGKNKQLKQIKNNPGFKTTVSMNKIAGVLKQGKRSVIFQVENIDDIRYLATIPIYIDSLTRLTQDITSTGVNIEKIQSVCLMENNEPEDIVPEELEPKYHVKNEYEDDDEDADTIPKNALDILYGDEDSEEDEESDKSGIMVGGATSDDGDSSGLLEGDILGLDELEGLDLEPDRPKLGSSSQNIVMDARDLDGLSLTNKSNPFFNKMFEKDPALFVVNKGKFKSYSRMCSSSARRQPVLLTDDELKKIQEEHPGFLRPQDVIKYGSSPDKQFNYICPRYWCLKTGMPISPEEIKTGKCGKIIPRNATKVPKGHYVFEFFDSSEHGTQQKYIQHYPGFVKDSVNNHPDGLCIPCCFKNWDVPSQRERREK